ncbi:MAG: excinuclease ABC subunit UvrC [candidate division Zixibacteria bacterium]|nr:excinuclease ABC subunit UvrC [candidate division Zixibacteria bacterium]
MLNDVKAKLENLPTKPGVYLMKDKSGRIIYVGKAKSLRNRVRAYFHDMPPYHLKISALVSKIFDFDVLVTDSEMEALILESNLIKEYKPRYNVNLKDDKRYPYLKVTFEAFPRVLVVRRVKKDKAKYFGPYTNVKAMRQTLRILRRIFPVRSCNVALPSQKKIKLCLDFYIKRCLGPCEGKISEKEYREIIDNVCLFLSGKNEALLSHLKERMEHYAREENFEMAAQIRDQIKALDSVTEKQKVADVEKVDKDIIAFASAGSMGQDKKDVCVVALQIREGILIGRQNFHLTAFKETEDKEILSTFLRQYYMHSVVIPPEIILPIEIDDQEMIQEWLTSKKARILGLEKRKVRFLIPQRGEKVKLLDMATYNAQLSLDEVLLQKSEAKRKIPQVIKSLEKDLYLSVPPRRIAAFDISNLGSSDAVGSLVFFEGGRPRKSQYRRFKIKTVQGQDDFAMMGEVVKRYFTRAREEKKEYPDLVLVDGGKGQLSTTLETLNTLGIKNQNVIALAKRLDEVFLPGKKESLMIPKGSASLKLLQRIRNEAHRFAIEYHRKLRKKRTIRSELDRIPGIGPARRKILLRHFGSVEKIKQTSLEVLLKTDEINKKVAENVYKYFHP